MADTSRLCRCGHPQSLHVGLARECQKTAPTACTCQSWMHDVANVDATTAREVVHDPVNAPAHYHWIPGVQPIDIAEHLPYNLGAALKYIVRAGRKGDAIEDLRKAAWHVAREIERLSKVAK